ncbi:MAG TPA: neutral zinc metallopeptidase [Bacteroidales bacterium]|nr:neutral zinc metallopeptidase [Bacteroidales bacterium]
MKWIGRRQSGNVEDRRGISGKSIAGIGGVGGIIIAIIFALMGGDTSQIFNALENSTQEQGTTQTDARYDSLAQFTAVVLADTEDVWDSLFTGMGETYVKPTLVLFTNSVESACGNASSSVGPFYCSGDSKVYIDLAFLEELQGKIEAEGDFAQAYIIAHEVGHHVQNLLGILDKVHAKKSSLSESEYNDLSVRLELQADFLSGVWAHYAQKMKSILETGDIEEAMNASAAVGDDKIQMKSQGYVVPDAFTHGTSKQRTKWFMLGFNTGDLANGDTFGATVL